MLIAFSVYELIMTSIDYVDIIKKDYLSAQMKTFACVWKAQVTCSAYGINIPWCKSHKTLKPN